MEANEFCPVILNDTTKTRISLKIQDGCDNRCSYCIIPFGRGKSRSAAPDFVINEINRYVENGYKEVVLTGIHIGLYEGGLLPLLQRIELETKIPRYRLGSLNPHEITNDLLDFLQTSEKFCPHFHLSLQSACNTTLKRMNRHYTVEQYLEQIEDIASRFDRPFFGSDIIAGFVGETEEDFQITVDNLKKSKLSKIHVFPYSIRKGTSAEKMEGHLPESIKDERATVIKKISEEKFNDFLKINIGTTQEVLIEKHPDKQTGLYKGLTRNYINVLLKEGSFNTLKKVLLTKENIKNK
jgi:threonylcarbamoyladenosine tRNA methylthiotransferase MtaB